MIQTPVLLTVRDEFARRARYREEDRALKERDFLDAQKRRKEEQDARDDHHEDADLMVVAVMASDDDISLAMVERNIYDVATVEALIENGEALEQIEEELRIMLDQAYLLPDGRRVFKTEDGSRVFDEDGVEVTDFDPDSIEDWRPRWEAYADRNERRDLLAEQREQILAYQARLDEARDRLDAGEISKEDLDRMMSDLREEMPEAVRAHLPEGTEPELAAAHPTTPEPVSPIPQSLPTVRLDMPSL